MNNLKTSIIAAIFICAFAAGQCVFADDKIAAGESSSGIITETIINESVDVRDDAADKPDDQDVKSKRAKSVNDSTGQKPKKSKKNDGSAEQDVKSEIVNDTTDNTAESNIIGAAAPGRPLDGKSKKSKGKKSADPNKKSTDPADKKSAQTDAKKDGTEFKLGGILETGFDINYKANKEETVSKALAKGEIEISARPAKRVRAEIGIEYNMWDTVRIDSDKKKSVVTMDKFYGQYGITENSAVRAGIMKKMFGLEERAGLAERCFRSRSIINSALDDYGFLDHDLTLQYRQSMGESWRFGGGFSWSVADSLRYLQNYSAQYDVKNMTFVLAGIIRHYDIHDTVAQKSGVEGVAVTFASSISAMHNSKYCISEAEFTVGTNPRIKIRENNRNAFIFGARAQERFPIAVNTKILRQVTPAAELAMYWDDLDESGDFDTQLRMGLVFGFAKNSVFQLRNTFGTIWRTADGETNVRRYRYDSEVVVIF